MPNPIYRIAKWQETFEKSDSKRYRSLTWVSLPVGFTSNGYHALIDEFEGEAPAIYGAWCALLSIAAQAPTRGTLASSKQVGYSLDRIAAETRMPKSVFEKLFAWALREDVCWLEVIATPDRKPVDTLQSPERHPSVTQQTPELPNQTKQDLTRHNQTLPTNYRACDSALEVLEFSSGDLSEHARQVFEKSGYDGRKGKNLWKFAGLWKAGRISEDELFDSCQNASEKGKDPPALVFTCLRERLRERAVPVELSDLLKTVKINPYCPSEAPQDALR